MDSNKSGQNSKPQSRQQSMRLEQRLEENHEDYFLDSAKKLTSDPAEPNTPQKDPGLFLKAKSILDPSGEARDINLETKPRSRRHFQKKVSLYS